MSAENELAELQIKLAFQEQALEALDEVVIRQQGRVERLEERLAVLQEQYDAVLDRLPDTAPGEEPPPHY